MRTFWGTCCVVVLAGYVSCGLRPEKQNVDAGDGSSVDGDAGQIADVDSGVPDAGDIDGGVELGDGGLVNCSPAQLDALEAEIGSTLDVAAENAALSTQPAYTLIIERADGRKLIHSHGGSTATTSYRSASTSKWVAAAVILDLVDQGKLTLETKAHEVLPSFWNETTVTLRHLLSFRSGFIDEPLCMYSPTGNFDSCVESIYTKNAATALPAGSEFSYSGTHLQIAGKMAMTAASKLTWTEVFDAFKMKTGLFSHSDFSVTSTDNPLLAGGMRWTGDDYHAFLRALVKGELLKPESRAEMFANQRGSATVGSSPIISRFNEDWAYGLGNWLECPTAIGNNTYNCGQGHKNSSPGAFGAYPFIDFDHSYFGILAREGDLATFHEGLKMFRTVEALAQEWSHNQCRP